MGPIQRQHSPLSKVSSLGQVALGLIWAEARNPPEGLRMLEGSLDGRLGLSLKPQARRFLTLQHELLEGFRSKLVRLRVKLLPALVLAKTTA